VTEAVDPFHHLDEHGQPCALHEVARHDGMLHFATIGSLMSSFNHDIASKLQGLMMALDEISELAEPHGDADLMRAAETAHSALKELNKLLVTNRAFTKPPVRTRSTLRELASEAGERVGVTLHGELPDASVDVGVPMMLHAFALALDVAAGVGRSRGLEVAARIVDSQVELRLPLATTGPANASESLAIAAWVFARAGGELRCGERQLILRLPIAG